MAQSEPRSIRLWPRLPRLVACLVGCQLAGGLGGILTSQSVTTWYPTLNKPPFNPPAWLFAPVWTLLYALMGLALAILLEQPAAPASRRLAQWLFGLQLALNTLWSGLFFGLRSPGLALIEIMALWLAILLTIIAFWRISRLAAWLLLPYLLWVSFASLLNYELWRRNSG